MLGSCSSSDDMNGGGTGNTGFNKEGNGFMSISVNLQLVLATQHVQKMTSMRMDCHQSMK